jgi:hypothetical protein
MAAFDFRPRSNTELLDASVEFIRGHFGTLAAVIALGQIPITVLTLMFPPSPTDPFARWREHPLLAGMQVVLTLWFGVVMSLAFVHTVDDEIHGRKASISSALSRALPRSGGALLMVIVTYIVFMLWAMLFLFPFIWAYARYFANMTSYAIEGLGPFAAIRRSKELAKGNNGRAIALALVPVAVFSIIVLIIQQGLLGSGAGVRGAQIVSSVFSIVLYPFMVVPAIFLYYDLRTRREGLDLDFAALPNAAA